MLPSQTAECGYTAAQMAPPQAAAKGTESKTPSLSLGKGKFRCPKCKKEGDWFFHFRELELVEEHRRELNPVYKHLPWRGGCGHVFSPGDPQIMEAYLAGDLIPKSWLEEAKLEIEDLRTKLEASLQKDIVNPDYNEGRVAV